MAGKKLMFSEQTKSQLANLFGGNEEATDWTTFYENVRTCKPKFSSPDGASEGLIDLQSKLIDFGDFVQTREFDASLNDGFGKKLETMGADNRALQVALDRLPDSPDTTCEIEMYKVRAFPEVRAFNTAFQSGKFYHPRFIIEVGDVPPNSSVRVNTGYVIRVPQMAKHRRLDKGKIVQDSTMKLTAPCVIVPYFYLTAAQEKDIIPCIFSRDPEDTGFLTFSFSTLSGKVGKLSIMLRAFVTTSPDGDVYLTHCETADKTVTKTKDFKDGRYTANLKVKFDPTSMKVVRKTDDGVKNQAVFDTYAPNDTVSEKQKLIFTAKYPVLFSSRKREWYDPNLITFGGMFDRRTAITPFVLKNHHGSGEKIQNSVCCTFVTNKLILFSRMIDSVETKGTFHQLKIINGAFVDVPRYDGVRRNIRQLLKSMSGLKLGAEQCQQIIARKIVPEDRARRILEIYDYHHMISPSTVLQHIDKSDEMLFDTQLTVSKPLSVTLDQAFRYLASVFCKAPDSEASSNVVETKRATETGEESLPSKRAKTE